MVPHPRQAENKNTSCQSPLINGSCPHQIDLGPADQYLTSIEHLSHTAFTTSIAAVILVNLNPNYFGPRADGSADRTFRPVTYLPNLYGISKQM